MNRSVLIGIRLAEAVGLLQLLWWGEESRVLFWKWKKEGKFYPLSSITHVRMKMYWR